MRKISMLLTLVLALTLAIGVALPVSAAPNTKVDLVGDVLAAGDPYDMSGPVMGFVNTNQDADGNLRIVVMVKGATPLTTYEIFLVGGPTHAQATGYITIGYMTTNGAGIGNSGAIWVDAATMAPDNPFGAGPHHVDIEGDGDGKWFVAGPIPYTLP